MVTKRFNRSTSCAIGSEVDSAISASAGDVLYRDRVAGGVDPERHSVRVNVGCCGLLMHSGSRLAAIFA